MPQQQRKRSKKPWALSRYSLFSRRNVIGQIGKESIGSFSHKKLLKEGQVVVCEVHVFPLEVTRQRKTWPEKGKREVQWFSRAEAARTVQEPVLSKMIRDLHKNEK